MKEKGNKKINLIMLEICIDLDTQFRVCLSWNNFEQKNIEIKDYIGKLYKKNQ